MLEAMRKANLEPSRFDDKRSPSWATLRNHTPVSPRAVACLRVNAAIVGCTRIPGAFVVIRKTWAVPDWR
jgi:hypothetical protein